MPTTTRTATTNSPGSRSRSGRARRLRPLLAIAVLVGAVVAGPSVWDGVGGPATSALDVMRGAVGGTAGGHSGTGDPGAGDAGATGDTPAPGTGSLAPPMRRSVNAAIAAAAQDGVELVVTSGYRTPKYQQKLYEEAIVKYGSPTLARRWVLPPSESKHVTGEAVDVGPPSAAAWLEANGERFGLCRRYENEPWHFERLAGALGSACPPMEPHA